MKQRREEAKSALSATQPGMQDQHNDAQDNEFGEMSISVSNEEFFEFVLDGGHTNDALWTREGWESVRSNETTQPTFWVLRGDGEYFLPNMLVEVEMPWDWPVIANQLEAEAFSRSRWKSTQLSGTCCASWASSAWSSRSGSWRPPTSTSSSTRARRRWT